MAVTDLCRAGGNGSLPLTPSGVLDESQSGTAQWLWTYVSHVQKLEMDNIRYTILHGFADYNLPLKINARANGFLHTPSSSSKDTLEQLQQFVHGTFQKKRGASTAMEKRVCI